jgi:hypothetical protein
VLATTSIAVQKPPSAAARSMPSSIIESPGSCASDQDS